jgi:hypothetical protein
MRKLVIGITAVGLLLAGIFVWNAEATPLAGSAILRSAANHSLVEKTARRELACPRSKPYLCQTPCVKKGVGPCWYCSPRPCMM